MGQHGRKSIFFGKKIRIWTDAFDWALLDRWKYVQGEDIPNSLTISFASLGNERHSLEVSHDSWYWRRSNGWNTGHRTIDREKRSTGYRWSLISFASSSTMTSSGWSSSSIIIHSGDESAGGEGSWVSGAGGDAFKGFGFFLRTENDRRCVQIARWARPYPDVRMISALSWRSPISIHRKAWSGLTDLVCPNSSASALWIFSSSNDCPEFSATAQRTCPFSAGLTRRDRIRNRRSNWERTGSVDTTFEGFNEVFFFSVGAAVTEFRVGVTEAVADWEGFTDTDFDGSFCFICSNFFAARVMWSDADFSSGNEADRDVSFRLIARRKIRENSIWRRNEDQCDAYVTMRKNR